MAIDQAMAEVVASSTQPALGAIRLAWWREALERLDSQSPPAEPRLRAAAGELLPRGIAGADLARIEDGYAALFDEAIDWSRVKAAGERLLAIGARVLDAETDPAVGRVMLLGRAKRLGLSPSTDSLDVLRGRRIAKPLRPMTALAKLAVRDLRRDDRERQATPGRATALLSHALFGTIA